MKRKRSKLVVTAHSIPLRQTGYLPTSEHLQTLSADLNHFPDFKIPMRTVDNRTDMH
jgi:hypothetical protein